MMNAPVHRIWCICFSLRYAGSVPLAPVLRGARLTYVPDLFLAIGGACRAQHVLPFEVSFVGRVFVDETVDAIPRHLHRPRPRPRLGIGNGELVVDRPIARARE